MKKGTSIFRLLAVLLAFGLVAAACSDDDGGSDETSAGDGRLAQVIANDVVECGGNDTLPGFGIVDADGAFSGFDIDFCGVIAAAVLGDSSKINVTPLVAAQRFPTLQSGEIDVLIRNTTYTASRDGDEQANFLHTTFYDGQGFMVPTKLGVKSAKALGGASVCIQTGTTTELNLADFFRANNMKYNPVPIETNAEARENYLAGRCDVYTTDASGLAATRAAFDKPDEHMVLPEIISKEPLGPAVRQGDDQWADIVRWTLFAMIAAEEYGITSKNVKSLASKGSSYPEINRLLGKEALQGREGLGLPKNWAVFVIGQVGNYGEVFERNLGPKTALGIARGVNAQWTNGGLMYAPPFR